MLSNSPELPCNLLDNTRKFLLFCTGQQPSLTKKYLCLIFSVNLRLKSYSNFSKIPKNLVKVQV